MKPKLDLPALAMGIVFSLMWSSAFATARIIVADAPPLWALTFRFAISGAIAVGAARALGQDWRLSRPVARSVLIFGLCQNALYLGLNFVALQWIQASLAAIIASAMPLIVALLGWIWRGERVAPLGQIGLALGIAGVAVIMGTRVTAGANVTGVALCVVGATALAVATLMVRAVSAGGNLLMVVGLQMWVGSVVLMAVALLTEPLFAQITLPLVLAMAYQLLVPGLAATLLWFTLVRRVGAVRASTFHFLNPFFGVAMAAALLGEHVSATDIVGVLTAMAGIMAVQLSRQAAAKAAS
ncbi:MAG: DMT family transporter [Alphaproteobacteria bacterium]